MHCPRCDGELVARDSAELRCQECGKRYKNLLHAGANKINDAIAELPDEIKTNRDLLSLLSGATKIEKAYAEMIDELTAGGRV